MKLAEYERELTSAREKLDAVSLRIRELQQEESELTVVVRGWEAIISRERKLTPTPPQVQQPSAVEAASVADVPTRDYADNSGSLSFASAGEEEEESDNKTQFVRDYLKANALRGAKPEDLKAEARKVGMTHPPSWPYGALARLKKRNEVIKRKGRFYLAAQPPGLSLVG